jgi:hypothetical protein
VDDMSMGDEPREVAITATTTGAKIVVNGVDMSRDCAGYQIQQAPGQPAQMLLFPRADAAVFEGMAVVQVADTTPPGDAIADFLRSVDPAALNRAALDRDLDGSSNELTVAMLEQLADWAQGK